MRIRLAVVLALAALALSACATKSAPAGPALEARLSAQRWTLQSATDGQGQAITALFPRADSRADPRFTVEFKDGRVGIRGGCNAMGGSYQIDAASFEVQLATALPVRDDGEGVSPFFGINGQ